MLICFFLFYLFSKQGVDNVLIDFNQLVLRLLSQSKITLETYVQFLQQVTEKSSSNSNIVPEDGTIHELTTNVSEISLIVVY